MKQAVCGLIGVGGIARSQHLGNLRRSPFTDFKWICDLDSERLAQAKQEYDISNVTEDIEDVLSDDEVNMVVVATREDAQAPLTIKALEAGKNVYVEKPLASTPEECDKVVKAQQESGKFVAVGFNRRFAPAYLKARDIIASQGGLYNMFYRISDAYFRWGPAGGYKPGSRVFHEVCHIFDIVRWFAGSDVETVYCASARDDDESIVLKMKSGQVITILDSGYVDEDMPKEHLEAILYRGAVMVEDFVEVKTYSLPDYDPVYKFAGHSHPQKEYTHKWLLEETGIAGLEALRRMRWKLNMRYDQLMEYPGFSEKQQLKRYIEGDTPGKAEGPNPNYMIDKGWQGAVNSFAQCVVNGEKPSHAGPADALAASQIANAVVESRSSNKIVPLR